MTTFKIVNFVVGAVLLLVFLCDTCSSIDVTHNVRFIKRSSENYNQEEEKNVISPKIFSLNKWIKDQESSAEAGIRWKGGKRSLSALKNKDRVVRQVNNGYQNLYPTLPTQYPNVNINSGPYRPSAPSYEPTPYNNFNNYPAPNQNYISNMTSRYPPNNSITFRPPYYPPKHNLNYGNSSTFNQNLSPYNRTGYGNTNNFSSQTGQHNSYNNFPVPNQNFNSNTSGIYPPYNPANSRPQNYPSNQNFNYGNSPPFNQSANQYNRSSYSYPNNFSNRNNATYQQNTHFPQNTQTGSRQPNYYPSFAPNNNNTQMRNQFINNDRYNQYPSNYNPNLNPTNGQPPVYPQYNTSMNMLRTNASGYGSNSYHHNTHQTNGFNPGNGFPSSGSQSRPPGYPVNNGTYTNQSPYFPSSSTFKPTFYDNSKYNYPNQNNYVEPNHFFYTPGQNPRY